MKQSSTNTLIAARTLLSLASQSIVTGDKNACTAGLIMLQDGVELVVLAALDELDADESRSLESKSFDELLGELKKLKIQLTKSGTIKALNKQRVLSKHYGQLVEPATAANYLKASEVFVDNLVMQVFRKLIREVFLTDLLKNSDEKEHLIEAIRLAQNNNYLDALIEIRKAFYVAYENGYCVFDWRNTDGNEGWWAWLGRGGLKAPTRTKSKEWISENIKKPTDYVQISHDQLKIDCMEWGVSTVEIDNLRRLTPEVVKLDESWHIDYDFHFPANEANQANFNLCMDIVIDFLRRKEEFQSRVRTPRREAYREAPAVYVGRHLHISPTTDSEIVHTVQENWYYQVNRIVTGFNSNEKYLYLMFYQTDEEGEHVDHVWGYLLDDDA